MIAALRNRLTRLERGGDSSGCSLCWNWPSHICVRLVEVLVGVGDQLDGDEPAPEGPWPDGYCPLCGRRPVVVQLVHDPDFYGNAERLSELDSGADQE